MLVLSSTVALLRHCIILYFYLFIYLFIYFTCDFLTVKYNPIWGEDHHIGVTSLYHWGHLVLHIYILGDAGSYMYFIKGVSATS